MKTKEFEIRLDLPKNTVKRLREIKTNNIDDTVTYALGQLIKKMEASRKKSEGQFNKRSTGGLLTRVFYYQKKAYPKDVVLQKMSSADFVKKWSNKKKFKKIWDNYVTSEFNDEFKPIFVRSSRDDMLRVGTPKERAGVNYEY